MDILVRFWKDLGKILGQSWLTSCQDLAMVFILPREPCSFYKNIVKSYLARKHLQGSEQNLTSLQIYIARDYNFLLARYKN